MYEETFHRTSEKLKECDVKNLLDKLTQFTKSFPQDAHSSELKYDFTQAIRSLQMLINYTKKFEKMSTE